MDSMLRVTARKTKPNSGRVEYVGIVADAAKLGVSRPHLWQVLKGKRRSHSLLRRYHALKRKAA
jgi:hypothetical protein